MSKVLLIAIVFLGIFVQSANSQDSIPNINNKLDKSFFRNDQHWIIEVPIWIPGYRGNFTYGEVSVEGEDGTSPENPIEPGEPLPGWGDGTIFSRLFNTEGKFNFYFMNLVNYKNRRFIGVFDAFAGGVGGSVKFRYNNKEIIQADFSTALFRVFVGYQLYQYRGDRENFIYELYGYAGYRMHSAKIKSNLNTQINSIDINPYWGEPLFGVRNNIYLNRWLFTIQADMGGFYIDNKVSYMINLTANYRMSNLLSVKFGWTDWDIYNKEKFLNEDLVIKMHLSGPMVAIGFHF